MHHLILIAFTFSVFASPNNDVEDAKKIIRAIMSSSDSKKIFPQFRVDKCPKPKFKIEDLFLLQKNTSIEYKFSDGCDIEGTVQPKLLRPFPLKLALRHAGDFKEVVSENKITSNLDTKPILLLETRSGSLKNKKGSIDFELDYKIQFDPLSEGDARQKNLGGELRINRIYGKKVNIKEKILIK